MAKFLLFCLFAVFFGACVRSEMKLTSPFVPTKAFKDGTYHKIRAGETLWKLSQIYDIDIAQLAKVNNIKDFNNLQKGRLVFIPDTQKKMSAELYLDIGLKEHTEIKTQKNFFRPLKAGCINLIFGANKGPVKNKGLDIQATDSLSVYASKKGVVTFCGRFRGMGLLLVLDHQDGYTTVYSNLAKTLIKEGDVAEQGETIAFLGRREKWAKPVLHFEIREKGKAVDPLKFLPNY
ncbi:hypothetical protein AB834_02720 [PVC group bacterium (ex Bugula neritina AB1)]|nr:hypothetical protein AB834_02720 [PVC group bacterium (ex Bugula neritina AB1)]